MSDDDRTLVGHSRFSSRGREDATSRSEGVLSWRRPRLSSLSAYRPLFDIQHARRLVTCSLIARLSIAMLDIPSVLLVQAETRSYAIAGITVALSAVGIGLSAPARGRALDRYGSPAVTRTFTVLRALAVASLWPAAATHHAFAILPIALIGGLLNPPIPASMRLQWRTMIRAQGELLARAYAFETVAQVSLFVIGPAVAAIGISTVGSGPTLLGAGALLLGGGIPYSTRATDDRARDAPATHSRVNPIRISGVRVLVAATFTADAALGVMDITVTAFARKHGHAGTAGLLLAAFSLSAVSAGTIYGSRSWQTAARRRLALLTGASALLFLPLILASSPLMLVGLLVIAGAPNAAQWTTSYLVLDGLTPVQSAGEALNWMSAANASGVAVGDAVAGLTVDASGTRPAFALAAALLACATLLLLACQKALAA